jgi:hypothetical protein
MPYRPQRGRPLAGEHPAPRSPSWKRATAPESRWPAFAAALVVIAGQTWVSNALGLRPAWLLPFVSAVLLGASVAVYIPERETPSKLGRGLSIGLVGVLVVTNVASLVLLVRGVFIGSALGPGELLLAGLALWVALVAVFALLFWELDGNGPEARSDGYADYPDLVFPQQQVDQQGLAADDWKPTFSDYLYVSLTNATAFSPTDTMPYSKRAKLAMGLESSICIFVLAMIVARAINVAKG